MYFLVPVVTEEYWNSLEEQNNEDAGGIKGIYRAKLSAIKFHFPRNVTETFLSVLTEITQQTELFRGLLGPGRGFSGPRPVTVKVTETSLTKDVSYQIVPRQILAKVVKFGVHNINAFKVTGFLKSWRWPLKLPPCPEWGKTETTHPGDLLQLDVFFLLAEIVCWFNKRILRVGERLSNNCVCRKSGFIVCP